MFKEKKQQAEKPADVDEQTWRDFVSHRKNKKASITKTAISGIRKEAEKAGISLTEALSICVIRGWIGFDATWLKNNQNSNQKPKEKTLIEKMLEAEDRKSKTFDVQATELVTKQSGDNYLAITEEARDE